MGRIMKILLLNLLITLPSFAGDIRDFKFKEQGKIVSIKTEWDSKSRIAVSSHCRIDDRNSCDALKQFDKAIKTKMKSNSIGTSASPGVIMCEGLGGDVVIGQDTEGNENSFCKFKDQSLIDCGTLMWYF